MGNDKTERRVRRTEAVKAFNGLAEDFEVDSISARPTPTALARGHTLRGFVIRAGAGSL